MLKLHESEQNWDGGKAGREASRAARLLHVCLSVSVCLTSSTGIITKVSQSRGHVGSATFAQASEQFGAKSCKSLK